MDTPIPSASATEEHAPIPSGAPPAAATSGAVPIPAGVPAAVPAHQQLSTTSAAAEAPSGTLAQVAGYFNVGVGLVLLAALGLYAAGFGKWVTHLGLSYRDEGIHRMETATVMLFWLLVVLGVVRFVQYHTAFTLQLLAVLVVLFGGWFVIKAVQASGGENDER